MSKTETGEAEDFDPLWITGKDLERHFSLENTLLEFSQLFKHTDSNDRALVIVGGAFLDTLLENILTNFLVNDPKEVAELLRHDQPLGSYGNRVRAAYCLGLIGKTVRDDLRAVGKIRNRFAHDLCVSFDDDQIRSWCQNLRWHATSFMKPPDEATDRDLFHVGVNCLVSHLHGIVSLARAEKRSARSSG